MLQPAQPLRIRSNRPIYHLPDRTILFELKTVWPDVSLYAPSWRTHAPLFLVAFRRNTTFIWVFEFWRVENVFML